MDRHGLLAGALMLCGRPDPARADDFTLGDVLTDTGLEGSDTNSLRDAIPAASLVAGTWRVAEVTNDSFANTEAYTMLEAGGLMMTCSMIMN